MLISKEELAEVREFEELKFKDSQTQQMAFSDC
jgi:hypothetical protein